VEDNGERNQEEEPEGDKNQLPDLHVDGLLGNVAEEKLRELLINAVVITARLILGRMELE
jgi:hypothetical protein